ncbi:glycosyl hydrolase family 28-related protein [Paracoccus sp. (in: a-proteobacteria)]|uniref:glycosyl hydrolase family 28-related protein n=1 Tax=Paracoccus sp. TaxID=267 RepID=UPI003A83556B
MNIAITNGISLMPPAFRAGLNAWSQTDGSSGSPTWAGAGNAALVPADQDFGSCLEIVKQQTTTRLRFMGETPIYPGVYLRVSARVKMVAGAKCGVRIAGWAGDGARNHVGGLTETGPTWPLETYGEVVEISAIVGVGSRSGVDMGWGTRPVFGRFGLDLVGANGGAVRIESIRIEDVTAAFIPSLIDWVDVRDFGAAGDGVTNDRAAFVAADQAANGGWILVPEGTFFISGDLGIAAPIRFKGKLRTPDSTRIALMASFDFPTYADAFGDETLGFRKALQALFGYTDHVTLDLRGRRVDLTAPLLIDELAPALSDFSNRRVITNGSILARPGSAWNNGMASSTASYDPANPLKLTNVANVAAIEIGSHVNGNGVGREVYVNGRDIAGRTLSLSQPLYGGAGTRSYGFTRFRYLFDFAGVGKVDRLNLVDLDLNCEGIASGIMLPTEGQMNVIRDCYLTKPKDRGITSIGRGCQGLTVDRCEFLSNEMDIAAQNRSTIAINTNANDVKVRDNRFVRFAHFMVAGGGGHIVSGNHWFQGDGEAGGLRYAGLVLTLENVQATITGNYVDNASVEWTNEHSARPDFTGGQYSFGGLTITGNTFLCSNTVSWFTWLTVKPHGSGHFIHGLTVSGNVFKALDGTVQRIDRVDSSIADLDFSRMRNLSFDGNTFNGIQTYVANPLLVTHTQTSADKNWTFPVIDGLPFQGWTKSVQSLVAEAAVTDAGGSRVSEMPWAQTGIGTSNRQIRLNWNTPVKGRISAWVRMDRPQ